MTLDRSAVDVALVALQRRRTTLETTNPRKDPSAVKYLTRTTLAAGLIAGAGLMFTVPASSSSSPAAVTVVDASPASSSPIVVEETPRLAQAAQVVDVAPVAADDSAPAQEAPTAAAVEDPAPTSSIADSITVVADDPPPAPAPPPTRDPLVAVWVYDGAGNCNATGPAEAAAAGQPDGSPRCAGSTPGHPVVDGAAPSAAGVWLYTGGRCIQVSAGIAAANGQSTDSPQCAGSTSGHPVLNGVPLAGGTGSVWVYDGAGHCNATGPAEAAAAGQPNGSPRCAGSTPAHPVVDGVAG